MGPVLLIFMGGIVMPNRVTPYVPTDWQNRPSSSTPINETNLRHIEIGIKNVTDALNAMPEQQLSPATTISLGGIIVGDRLSIDQNGRLSANEQTVDDSLSTTSTNPVQNKVISTNLQKAFMTTDELDTSPGSGCTFPFLDGTTKKRIRWDNIAATLKLYFDTLYNNYTLPTASSSTKGGIKVGNNLSIDANGVLSADVQPTIIPIASASTLGGIKVGTNLSIDENGVLSAVSGSYTPTPATASNLGCIKVGSGLSITQDGTLSATGGGSVTVDDALSTTSTNPVQNKVITTEINKTFRTSDSEMTNVSSDDDTFPIYSQVFHSPQKVKWSRIKSQLKTYFDNYYNNYTLPKASDSTLGGVKVGSNLSIDSNGVLSADAQQYTLPTASTSTLGGVKIDGSTITIDQNGVISSSGGGSYTLPTASTSTLGGVKIDGTTITIDQNGVISSVGGGSTIEYATSGEIIDLFNDGTDVYLDGESSSVTF